MPDYERNRTMLTPASAMPQRPPVHVSMLPVLRLDVETALSWLQFPQQDADNIEKKPKVHLEIECRKVEGKGQGVAPVGTRNPESLRHGAVWVDGRTDHRSRACSLRTGRPHMQTREQRLRVPSPTPVLASKSKGRRSGLVTLPPAPPGAFSGTKQVPSLCTVLH